MLQPSRSIPSISAFTHLNGQHNFNAHPFGILGCKVELHVMPKQRRTWEPHTKSGYYLGPAWEHYRCHNVWVEEKRATRVGQTVFFKHKHITAPQVTESDALLRASDELCAALAKAAPTNSHTKRAVDLLIDIFKGKANEAKNETDQRRVQREAAQEQRVRTETEQSAPPPAIPTKSDEQPPHLVPADDDSVASDDSSTFSAIEPNDELVVEGMEVSHPSQSAKCVAAPVLSQDDGNAPAYRTRSRHDRLFSALEVSGCRLTPQ